MLFVTYRLLNSEDWKEDYIVRKYFNEWKNRVGKTCAEWFARTLY